MFLFQGLGCENGSIFCAHDDWPENGVTLQCDTVDEGPHTFPLGTGTVAVFCQTSRMQIGINKHSEVIIEHPFFLEEEAGHAEVGYFFRYALLECPVAPWGAHHDLIGNTPRFVTALGCVCIK